MPAVASRFPSEDSLKKHTVDHRSFYDEHKSTNIAREGAGHLGHNVKFNKYCK